MYERILVPLDSSDLAEAVLPYVQDLASRLSAQVVLVSVLATPTTSIAAAYPGGIIMSPAATEASMEALDEAQEVAEENVGDYLESLAERFRANNINVRYEVIEGTPAEAILDFAEEIDASLIAMSTHGRGGLGRAIFGSVADEVLRKSRRPLLLIRTVEEEQQ